ncbi:nicotinate phosphoribosyltransferase [Undibacterium luofuense]|uniref:Nicotinamide phosphoribosyltransferase n=1 Tax=Undibacterium luofuense TaxID=2828733 RepID=A0A941DN29_9BURK|nr:nicotinate phosphoribosyltransferase [Undibacterium luofuense]MBR7783843.1 nicotinate phosphoribosyltransferase [Undibacterium luofuense]
MNTKNNTANGLQPFHLADFYKTGHPAMYPAETTRLVANFTPRSAKHAPVLPQLFDHKVVWFGLQGFIQEFLIDLFQREFFDLPVEQAVSKYRRRMDTALGAGAVPVSRLEALHGLGYLPLEIRSVPEGARVDMKVPPVIFMNTHPDFPWIATYIETLFSCEMWKPATVATLAFEFRKLLLHFAERTGTDTEFVNWQGHDFSMRGMSGVHSAMRCGAAHLLSFWGTDTIPALDYLEDYYGGNADQELLGGSIPASEHSVMALRILLTLQQLRAQEAYRDTDEKNLRRIAECEVIRRFVTQDYPSGMVSLVSDTFDFWNVITVIAPALREDIMQRQPDALGNAKVVFRPDSGDPVRILTGYDASELESSGGVPVRNADGSYTLKAGQQISDAERKGAVECLWETFGGTMTAKGYRLLDSHVGLIYGDSITLERARDIMLRLEAKGFASGNVVFGIGSFVYGMNTRDTFGFAMKAIYAEVGDTAVEIYKDPATDDGTKKSARGLIRVEYENDHYVLYEQQSEQQFAGGVLEPVFRDGKLLKTQTIAEIRQRLQASWKADNKLVAGWDCV